MKLTRKVGASMVAGGITLSGLFGLGLATATADPGQRCGVPNAPACQQAPQNQDWQHRDINQARQDHQPFIFNGHQVQPLPAGNGDGWGFWLLASRTVDPVIGRRARGDCADSLPMRMTSQ